jgi:hypothetical protein
MFAYASLGVEVPLIGAIRQHFEKLPHGCLLPLRARELETLLEG